MSEESTPPAKKPHWTQLRKAAKVADPVPDPSAALHARIAELEARLATGEKGAMDRVCKALKLDPKEVVEAPPEQMVDVYCHFPIRINSITYSGKCRVAMSTFYVIAQAQGDRRMRLLREMTGSKMMIDEFGSMSGSIQPKLVETYNDAGERIS